MRVQRAPILAPGVVQQAQWRHLAQMPENDRSHPLLTPGEAEEIRDGHSLLDLPGAVFSALFLQQLREFSNSRTLDTIQIVDEIKRLEGVGRVTSTKRATKFRRPPLKGLWHQHFFNARFIISNIGSYWQLHKGGNEELEQMLVEEMAAEGSGYSSDALAMRIAHRFTIEAYEQRVGASRITGEWIIFAKHGGRRFYLTIATHGEGDASIHERLVRFCQPEFPFLSLSDPERGE